MRIRISKWIIFKDSLFLLFYPFLAFDVFLFYDDSTNVLKTALAIWLAIFAVAMVFYLHVRRTSQERIIALQVAEIAFFSFEVLFFVGNLFLGSFFLFLIYTGNQFLI
jgi:hypothetical protein